MDEKGIHWHLRWLMDDFGSKVGRLELIFVHISATNPNQHDLHGPDESQTTIGYHHLINQEMMVWMSRKSSGI
jgi:hypothetical protein